VITNDQCSGQHHEADLPGPPGSPVLRVGKLKRLHAGGGRGGVGELFCVLFVEPLGDGIDQGLGLGIASGRVDKQDRGEQAGRRFDRRQHQFRGQLVGFQQFNQVHREFHLGRGSFQ
jgi:hypothetical protein